MSRVFIVQRPTYKNPMTGQYEDKFDLSPAEKFGTLTELLLPGNLPLQDGAGKGLMRILLQRLQDYTSDDFLLAIGDPVAIAAASCVAMDYSGGAIRILKWDRRMGDYLPFTVDLTYGSTSAGLYQDDH